VQLPRFVGVAGGALGRARASFRHARTSSSGWSRELLLVTLRALRTHSLLLAASFLGCAADNEIDIVYDPCSPLTLAVAPDLGVAELRGIEGAIAVWAAVLPTQLEIGSGPRAPDVLPIHFQGGDTPYRGMYLDTFGTIAISRDRLAPEDYPLAIAHELGHAFGLLHVSPDERRSIMNVGNLEIAPTEEDAAKVRGLWASCRSVLPGS
jgi:hypothetical protein